MQRVINVWAATALAGVVVVVVAFGVLWHGGCSSRPEPSNMEASIAMKAYDSSTPERYESCRILFLHMA